MHYALKIKHFDEIIQCKAFTWDTVKHKKQNDLYHKNENIPARYKDVESMNIKEIAKKSGVSVATVSRVLNHPESVAPKTKERVLNLIDEMGYKPNWFARGLNFNKTYTIGLLIPNILNPSYIEMAKGAEEVANQKGYMTLLCITEGESEKEKKYVQTLVDRRIDGMILVSSMLEDAEIKEITAQGIPVVLIGENKGNSQEPIIRIDCKEAAYLAMKHLFDCGYQDIALICGQTPEMENKNKLDGYEFALAEAGIPIKAEYVVSEENTIEGGYVAARKLLALPRPPRAVFTTSDLLAFGVMEAARDSELRIPEDLALMGFDNIRMANLMEPKLSTVAKPLHRMGLSGARLLFDVMESKNHEEIAMKEIVLQSKLKIRKSCGHKERISEIF